MTLTKFLRTGAAALGALAVASVTQANAADMYTGGLKEAPVYVPPPLWTGFYIGGHIGAAWESISFPRFRFDDQNYNCGGGCQWNGSGPTYFYNPAFMPVSTQSTANAFGGAQLGYNFQYGSNFVYGLELDLGGMAVNLRPVAHGATYWTDGSGNMAGIGTPVMFEGESNGGFYGDITGRLGYTWGTWMLYAKGGFAWLTTSFAMHEHVLDASGYLSNAGVSCINGWCDFNGSSSNTLTGWTVGGGVEWKVSPSWSIKVEYLHFDFTNFGVTCCNDFFAQQGLGVNNFNMKQDLVVDSVKLGFNYFWNAPPAPLK